MLKALAQDLRPGARPRGAEGRAGRAAAHASALGRIALSGHGLPTKTILAGLSARGGLWIDPMTSLKKAVERETGGAKDTIRERVKAISARCGGKERLYRNTLLFLAGTARGLSKLRQGHRE